MPGLHYHRTESCDFCQTYTRTLPLLKMVNVCAKDGKHLGRGSMVLRQYPKGCGENNSEHWAIECPQASDYQFIRFCPMCGRELPQE